MNLNKIHKKIIRLIKGNRINDIDSFFKEMIPGEEYEELLYQDPPEPESKEYILLPKNKDALDKLYQFVILWEKLEKLGIDKNRLQLAWISAAEGEKFANKAKEMSEIAKSVNKSEIDKTVNILKAERKKQEAKQEELWKKLKEKKLASEETKVAEMVDQQV